jgi:hypothetical protein
MGINKIGIIRVPERSLLEAKAGAHPKYNILVSMDIPVSLTLPPPKSVIRVSDEITRYTLLKRSIIILMDAYGLEEAEPYPDFKLKAVRKVFKSAPKAAKRAFENLVINFLLVDKLNLKYSKAYTPFTIDIPDINVPRIHLFGFRSTLLFENRIDITKLRYKRNDIYQISKDILYMNKFYIGSYKDSLKNVQLKNYVITKSLDPNRVCTELFSSKHLKHYEEYSRVLKDELESSQPSR